MRTFRGVSFVLAMSSDVESLDNVVSFVVVYGEVVFFVDMAVDVFVDFVLFADVAVYVFVDFVLFADVFVVYAEVSDVFAIARMVPAKGACILLYVSIQRRTMCKLYGIDYKVIRYHNTLDN